MPTGSRRLSLGAVLVLVVSLLASPFAPAQARASATPGAAKAISVTVPAKNWTNTGVNVKAGEQLRITAAGTWTDGSTTTSANGSKTLDADNFFNLADLGACQYCATTKTTNWGALIGYIGASPPAQGSYASAAIRAKAINVFYVGGNYVAKVLTTGRLWLAKNADAYSGYTVDNKGHITAKVTRLPARTATQIAAEARSAALAVKSATPLQQAETTCIRAIADSARDSVVKGILEGTGFKEAYEGATILNDELELYYEASNGEIFSAEFTFEKLIFETIGTAADHGLVPKQFVLFSVLGVPAVDCVEAAWWLDGWLGGQVGQYLRQKIWPATTADAGISGTWTLSRAVQDCVNLSGNCHTNNIVLKFHSCTATKCVMTRPDGIWQTHTITRVNRTWTATFTDNAFTCGSQVNPGKLTIRLIVTSSAVQHGIRVAKTLGGTMTASAATNPPTCQAKPSLLEDLHGGRS